MDMREIEHVRRRLLALDDPIGLLAGLFAYAPVGYQVFDASGRSILTNRAFRELFGS